jgi:hypothetical protein
MRSRGTSWTLSATMWALLLLTSRVNARAEKPSPSPAPASPQIRHPNLLLNQEEIEQIKGKIRAQPWAADLFERVKAMADEMITKGTRNERETALCYALTGDKRYANAVRRLLLDDARSFQAAINTVDLKVQPEYEAWAPRGVYAWAYDLTYDTFSGAERQAVEFWLRAHCRVVIQGERLWTTTPNLVFEKHYSVALVGYCLGDKELID